ncbi:pyruvate dehydrogenase [Escherichia coli]|nr:pyruvate dehydrogenase [Escherichia coli]
MKQTVAAYIAKTLDSAGMKPNLGLPGSHRKGRRYPHNRQGAPQGESHPQGKEGAG